MSSKISKMSLYIVTYPIYCAIGPQFSWCLPQYVYKNANPPQIEIIPPHRHTRAIEPLVLTRQLFHASILCRKFRALIIHKKDFDKNGISVTMIIEKWRPASRKRSKVSIRNPVSADDVLALVFDGIVLFLNFRPELQT